MNNHRGPDPTLFAHQDPVAVTYFGHAYRKSGELPVAHRAKTGELLSVEVTVRVACGDPGANLLLEADEAAYIGVPCTADACFPAAPPRGWRHAILGFRHDDSLATESGHVCDPSLAWQVPATTGQPQQV